MPLVPELFDLDTFERLTTAAPPALDTPLGRFAFSAALTPAARSTDAAHLRAGDVQLFLWDDPLARVELRVFTPAIALPDGMIVSAVRAAVWRVRARQPLEAVRLSCELVSDVIAWAPADPPSDATWFAVDQSPRALLRHREPAE